MSFSDLLDNIAENEYLFSGTSRFATSISGLLGSQLLMDTYHILEMVTLPNTFPTVDINVLSPKVPQTVKSPFFGNLTIKLLHQSFDIFSWSQIFLE